MVGKVGVGDGRCSLFIETFDNRADNGAAGVIIELMGLLIVAPVFEAGMTIATR